MAGGGCNMTCYSTVIFHEWGHGIDDAYGGISQTDGLSEGWGDLIATYASDQPIVGDAFRTTGGYIRTALNTYTYPAGTEVHLAGQTWMGWAEFVAEQAQHGQQAEAFGPDGYIWRWGEATFENWQSEFLQLVWQAMGLAILLFWGSSQSKESDERLEAKIDALLQERGIDHLAINREVNGSL